MSKLQLAGDDAAFQGLIDSFDEAGSKFKKNLAKLDELMADTEGVLKGTIGEAIQKEYMDNKADFDRLSATIKESGDYSTDQKEGFDKMVGSTLDDIGRN